ncbi:hypothetical protein [Tsukamurella strandjordii]|uniref:Mce-associated membrane protein n=1 Tax=Tsukamurella strandjordii TaxID=147577 RepID=A0AA90SIH1_9ACTN|nr:hypothetical protein [Tsukamurella strandjordii]MDP0400044.1 hypothetical protein [Tsukamurella strandjordii]
MSRTAIVLTAAATAAVALGSAAPAIADPGDAQTVRRIACEQYAVGASTFDYRDLRSWQQRLKQGVSPELSAKYDHTVGAMNQVLQPLQWVSTGRFAGAETQDLGNGVWRAKCFINVHATNTQAPQGRTTTTQYVITLDKNRGWLITDVGGDPAGQ